MVTIDLFGEEEDLLVSVTTSSSKKAPESNQEPLRAPKRLQVVVVPTERKREPKNPFLPPER